eukprot:evm.model.scf_783.4 EVM.evm.TU.scf_783.4   scf_783:47953-54365(+)
MGQRLGRPDVPEPFLTPQACALEPAEARRIRKLVVKGRLAPFYPGLDDSVDGRELEECPICFLFHRRLNRSRCCGQRICSECFVQIKTATGSYLGSLCPFCKAQDFGVEVCGPKTDGERQQERLDEQRVQEHLTREREAAASRTQPENRRTQPSTVPDNQSTLTEERGPEPAASLGTEDMPVVNAPTAQPSADTTAARAEVLQGPREAQPLGHRRALSAYSQGMTTREAWQCTEYLGVFPEDLGLRLDDFNELLLEQALITSMMEKRGINQHSQGNERRQVTHENHPSQPQGLPCRPEQISTRGTSTEDPMELSSWASETTDLNWESQTSQHHCRPEAASNCGMAMDDPADIGNWASESTDPNWEFVSLPRASTASPGDYARVSDGAGTGSCSRASAGSEFLQEGERGGAMVASASSSNVCDHGWPLGQTRALECQQGFCQTAAGGAVVGQIHRQLSLPSGLGEPVKGIESESCGLVSEDRRGKVGTTQLEYSEAEDSVVGQNLEDTAGEESEAGRRGSCECERSWRASLRRRRTAWLSEYATRRGLGMDLGAEGGEEGQDRDFGSMWRSLIAALTLTGDVNQDLRNMHIGMVVLSHSRGPEVSAGMSQGQGASAGCHQEQEGSTRQMAQACVHTRRLKLEKVCMGTGSKVANPSCAVEFAPDDPSNDSSNACSAALPELSVEGSSGSHSTVGGRKKAANREVVDDGGVLASSIGRAEPEGKENLCQGRGLTRITL